jgi:pilus assembly protein Flp/PilA
MNKLYTTLGLRLAMMFQGLTPTNLRREDGQSLAEYALILALIAVVVAGVLVTLQGSISGIFTSISSKL